MTLKCRYNIKITAVAVLVLLILGGSDALSRNGGNPTNQQGGVRILPLYQSWSLKGRPDFSELSFALSLYLPIGEDFGISLRGARANAGGDVSKVSGFTDTQLGLSYRWEALNVVLSLGVNLPSGKRKLTREEFETSSLLSKNIFTLQVPNFGQGLNINPRLIWAFPISDDVVMGLGASYQYKGKFRPLATVDEYDPGDEFLLTGGLDLRLGEAAKFSSDIIVTIYGRDKIGSKQVFMSGKKIVANIQFVRYFEHNELRVQARYRTRSKGQIAAGGILVPEEERTEPNQFEFLTGFNIRFSENFSARLLVEGIFHEETPAVFSGIKLYGGGIAPEVSLSPTLKIPARVKYQYGKMKNEEKISGLEIGVGMDVNF